MRSFAKFMLWAALLCLGTAAPADEPLSVVSMGTPFLVGGVYRVSFSCTPPVDKTITAYYTLSFGPGWTPLDLHVYNNRQWGGNVIYAIPPQSNGVVSLLGVTATNDNDPTDIQQVNQVLDTRTPQTTLQSPKIVYDESSQETWQPSVDSAGHVVYNMVVTGKILGDFQGTQVSLTIINGNSLFTTWVPVTPDGSGNFTFKFIGVTQQTPSRVQYYMNTLPTGPPGSQSWSYGDLQLRNERYIPSRIPMGRNMPGGSFYIRTKSAVFGVRG